MEIINADDRVAWRRFLLAATEVGAEGLRKWRVEKAEIPRVIDKNFEGRFEHIEAGLHPYAPLMACLVAAAETGKADYAGQLGWIESILEPPGYEKGQTVYHTTFPQTVLFVAQAFVGGMLMHNNLSDAAYQLAASKIPDAFNAREARPLYLMTRCNGWPETLEHTCTIAWEFLKRQISTSKWLIKAFGSERNCLIGIGAYYQLLSFLNYLKLRKDGELVAALDPQSHRFPVTVSHAFCVGSKEVVSSGYTLFLKQVPLLKELLKANGIDNNVFKVTWEQWMQVVGSWLGQVYIGIWPEMSVPQKNLPNDLNMNPYVV
ncbi:MAG: hypothetical protein ACO1QB_18665 [Verrucomicrobiales bacterium]